MATTLAPLPTHAAPPPRSARRVVALVLALPLVVAALFIALGLPAAKSGPHEVPFGVVGLEAATLSVADPDAFDVTTYADVDALREAVLDREVYGGLAVGPEGVQVLTATGGSPTVATLLGQVAAGLGTQTGLPVTVTDLVPLPDGDPRGTGFAAAALPLTMAGLLPAVLLSRVFPGRPWLAAGTAVLAAATIGGTVAALLQWPFGAVESGGWAVAGVVALSSAAISLTVLGLIGLLGTAGLALGAVLMVFLGSPLSGLASAPEFLPAGWGAFGQFMPPGAAGQALRSAAYFEGAGAGGHLVVLLAWAVLGVLLVTLGVLVRRRPAHLAGTAS